MLGIKDFQIMRALYDHKTFTRAARALNISQPALSRHLQILENKVGGEMFTRKRGGSTPTDLGRSIIEMGVNVLLQIEKIYATVEEIRGRQTSDISISTGFRVAEAFLADACARAITEMPQTRIKLKMMEWADVQNDVLERTSSFGLVHLPGQTMDSTLNVEKLDEQPAHWFVRPGHPLASCRNLTLQSVLSFPWLSASQVPPDALSPIMEARSMAGSLSNVHAAFPAIVNSSPAFAFRITKQSDAVIGCSVAAALDELRQGGLVALPMPRATWQSLKPGIVSLKAKALTISEMQLIQLIRAASRKAHEEALSWCAENGILV